jgi:hypothetical protein
MSLRHVDTQSVFADGQMRGVWHTDGIERLMTAVKAVQVAGDLFELVYEDNQFEAAHCPSIGDELNLLHITSQVQAQRDA